MNNDTIPSKLISAAERFRDRTAFNFFDGAWKSMTYGEFRSLSEDMACRLVELGLSRGDRAAIVSENRPGWCAAYMAIVMCGGIAVPVDTQLGADETGNLISDSEAKIVFFSLKTEPNVRPVLESGAAAGISLDATVRPAGSVPFTPLPISLDDIASIIYTSGTTGKPKGVMLTHRNFCSDAEAVIGAGVVTHEDNVLSVLPLHHTYPFMCSFIVPVFLGGTVTFGSGLKTVELVSSIKDNRVTVVIGVPRLFDVIRDGIMTKISEKGALSWFLLRLVRISGKMRRKSGVNLGKVIFRSLHKNFPDVRFFASGGARLDPSVMEDLEDMGFTVVEGYGLTETSPVITFNPVQRRKAGSVGVPFSCVDIRTDDDGEIMVRGPMVMKGYYRNPEATAESIRDEWFYTGDIGYLDKDGYLFITGRKKEVIILSSGKNIYPEDMEKLYMTSPLVKEMCVMGMERNGVVDSIHAVIVPDVEYAKKVSVGNISEAISWHINEVSSKLPEYMRIRGYTLYPEPLPRTPLGKLRRFMINGLVGSARPGRAIKAEDPFLLADEVGKKVAACISGLMEERVNVQYSDNLELDLGFDSLKKIEFISSLEEIFSVTLPESFVVEVRTVRDVVSKLKEYRAGAAAKAEAGERVSWEKILEKEPPPSDVRHVGYQSSFIETMTVFILLKGMNCLFRLLFRLRVEGGDNIPKEGPFVIAPNHASYLDGFLVAASVPFSIFRRLYFLGMRQFFVGGVKALFARLGHVIPIDAEMYLNKALQMSAYVLKGGRALCIFPEGGRSFDGSVLSFKKGIGVLAVELGMPVIPAYIKGAYEALPRGSRFIRPRKIKVIFGESLTASGIDMSKKRLGSDDYQFFADTLRERVVRLSQ